MASILMMLPPQLQPVFSDDFRTDTRGDYEIEGDTEGTLELFDPNGRYFRAQTRPGLADASLNSPVESIPLEGSLPPVGLIDEGEDDYRDGPEQVEHVDRQEVDRAQGILRNTVADRKTPAPRGRPARPASTPWTTTVTA